MSYAEQTAHRLYDTMKLDTVSMDVKRQLMILILSRAATDGVSFSDDSGMPAEDDELPDPMSLEEAMSQGCMDLESARNELHRYVGVLAKEYDLQ